MDNNRVLFILCMQFSICLSAQQLPDTAIAAKLKVKNFSIVKVEGENLLDTQNIYHLSNRGWQSNRSNLWEHRTLIYAFEIPPITLEQGRKIRRLFIPSSHVSAKCESDSVGKLFVYDAIGRLASVVAYICGPKNTFSTFRHYDSAGRLIAISCTPMRDIKAYREEYIYDSIGRMTGLVAIGEAFSESANKMVRFKMYEIVYTFNKNGLIEVAEVTKYGSDSISDVGRTPPKTRYRYLYVY